MPDTVKKLRTFAYGSRKLEVRAKKSASGSTWSVEVVDDAGKRTIGAFHTVTTELVANGKRHGIDVLQELAETAQSDFMRWSDRMNRP